MITPQQSRFRIYLVFSLLVIYSTLFTPDSYAIGVIELSHTGQTTCYNTLGTVIDCAGTGQDGNIRAGVAWPKPRFADNGDQTIIDTLTGLIWSKDANSGGSKTWQGALDYIETLNAQKYLGFNDWRLPNRYELTSLINLEMADSAVWLSMQGFTNVQAGSYWSSSTYAYYTNYNWSWYVHMSNGVVDSDVKSINYYVWPVRAGQGAGGLMVPKTGQTTSYAVGDDGALETGAAWPIPRFADNGNQTTEDTLTGLIWSNNASLGGGKNWQGALDYIKTLNNQKYLGFSDWRLPNRNELASLVNIGQSDPAAWLITQGLFEVRSNWYWSSSTSGDVTRGAWFVDMSRGKMGKGSKGDDNSPGYVWPVRGGQTSPLGISFSPIPAQIVNTLFDVGISAFDSAGNPITGWINLSLASGNLINPKAVYLENGAWSGQMTLVSPEADARIIASGQGLFGSSANFAVTDPNNPNAVGKIVGEVLGVPGKKPLVGIAVFITKIPVGSLLSVITDSNGRYSSEYLPVGDYIVYAVNGSKESAPSSVTVNSGRIQTIPLEIELNENPPVLIVPGVMGSTMKTSDKYDLYPRMPVGFAPADSLKIHNPSLHLLGLGDLFGLGDLAGLEALEETLNADFSVSKVPWDWRIDTDQAVQWYLIPAIRNALKTSQHSKVNIVAHSQGGLLVRAYIQSSSYRGDVDQLIMVGTPNQGSANPYWILEGGDPKTIDDMTETFPTGVVNFYSNVANRLYKAETGMNAFKTCPEAHWLNIAALDACLAANLTRDQVESIEFNSMKIDKGTMRGFLNDKLLGPKKLMASYDGFLRDESKNFTLTDNLNKWLEELNSNQTALSRMTPIDNNASPDKVRTALLLSTEKKTLRTINVDSTKTSLYPHGQPRSSQIFTLGDGTVPSYEALEPLSGYATPFFRAAGSHAELLGRFKDEIRNYLLCQNNTCASASPMKAMAVPAPLATAPVKTLSITLDGRVQPYLVDPNGLANGVNPESGSFSEEIPNSKTVLDVNASLIEIDAPANGLYTLSFKGNSDDIYDLTFTFADDTTMETRQFRGVHHNGITTLTFSVDSAAATKLNVTIPVAPPTNFVAAASGGAVQLRWTASIDPDVTTYDVYARKRDQPSFALLGSTATTDYDTTHFWNDDGTKDVWYYLVVARTASRTESFFETVVENRDYLVAGFTADKTKANGPVTVTFSDLSTGTVTDWQWDFDGDGSIDSTEQNPTHSYTAEGIYSVALTVTGPEGRDFRLKTGYIIIDGTAPELILSSPFDGTVTNKAELSINGTVKDLSGISTLKINSDTVPVNSDGSFSYTLILVNGANTVTAMTLDVVGNVATDTWHVTLDQAKPLLTITSPADNSMVNSPFITITGAINEDSTVEVNSVAATMVGMNFSATIDLTPGLNIIDITATDQAGNSTSTTRTISCDTTMPEVTAFALPATSASLTIPVTTFTATDDIDVAGYCVRETNSSSGCGWSESAPGSYSFISEGSKTLYAFAKDASGNISNSVSASTTITLPVVVYADLNNDGETTTTDALLALQMAIGMKSVDLKADVAPLINGIPAPDGRVTAADALVILRKAVGLW